MIGKKILRLRKKAKLTQEQLAKKIGVNRCVVTAWEIGKANPRVDTLKALSKALNCSINDFFQESMSSYSTGYEMKKKIKIKVTYENLTEKVKEDFNRLIARGK